MKKKGIILAVVTILFIISAIYYCIVRSDVPSDKNNETDDSDKMVDREPPFPELDIKYKLVSLSAECLSPQEKTALIQKEISMSKTSVFVTSNKSAIVLPSRNTGEFTDDISWLIVYPMKRNHEGQIVPATEITRIQFTPDNYDMGGGPFNLREGNSICVGINDLTRHDRTLAFGGKYSVHGYYSKKYKNGVTNHMLPFEASLVIPKELKRNKVYQVEIVLRDELEEKRIREEKEAEQEKKRLIAERDKITVHIDGLPTYPEHKHWHVHYFVKGSKDAYNDFSSTPPNPVILKGPLQLGGELNIFYGDGGARKVWAQIHKVRSREVILPDYADWLRKEEQLIDVNFKFVQVNNFKKMRYPCIYLYSTEDAVLSLYVTGFDYKMNLDDIKEGSQASLQMMPGTYYIKSSTKDRKKVSFGSIKIDSNNTNPIIDLSKMVVMAAEKL